jgi:DNA-binding response OmpR family regulator
MEPRVLVVEDEVRIAEAVAARLRGEGFVVELAHDGPGAVAAALARPPDLVVLDVMLPGFDGIEVCRRIQAERPVPVLMVTARDDEADMLIGLEVGADDYLTKPFSIRELVARVRALLRRVERAAELVQPRAADPVPDAVPAEPAGRTLLGDIAIDRAQRRVHRGAEEVHLTRTEFDLLVYLVERPRSVLSREQLLREVWGWPGDLSTRTVDSHVQSLRRKLGARLIRTVHGVGYALQPQPQRPRSEPRP